MNEARYDNVIAERSTTLGQPIKFVLVGAAGYAINLAIFALLQHVTQYTAAAAASYLISNFLMFLGNRYWTFGSTEGSIVREYLRYLSVGLVILALNVAILRGLVEGAHLAPVLAQAISLLLVTPVAFLGNKFWTFRKAAAA